MLQMEQQILQMQRALAQAPEAGACSPPWAGTGPYHKEGDAGLGYPDPRLFEEPPGRVSAAGSTSSKASVASTSRWPSSVHKSLHRLRQVSPGIGQLGSQGSEIVHDQPGGAVVCPEGTQSRRQGSQTSGRLAEELRAEIEDLLEAVPGLERAAAARQYVLESEERTERIDLQQWPRLKFSAFQGKPEDFDVFVKNTERIFQSYLGSQQCMLQMA